MTWVDLVRRKDLIGSDLLLQEYSGEIARGPISSVLLGPYFLTITLEWLAIYVLATNQWVLENRLDQKEDPDRADRTKIDVPLGDGIHPIETSTGIEVVKTPLGRMTIILAAFYKLNRSDVREIAYLPPPPSL